jgi:hypothetical protein
MLGEIRRRGKICVGSDDKADKPIEKGNITFEKLAEELSRRADRSRVRGKRIEENLEQ